jgi:methylmalonyl-CoA mutase
VQDPFAGSRFLEDYTDQLARAAWTLMQAGHDRAAAETEIALSKNQRIERLALGKDCLVGVNRYAAPQSTPTPSADWRLSTPFEALRRPGLAAVLLLEDAPPRARVDFVRQTLAVAGIECREVHTADEAVDGPEPILVLCSPDDHHAEAIPRLRAATPKQFGVAGQPKVAGADFYLHLECNRLELLGELVSRC